MKAVAFFKPSADKEILADIELPKPAATGRDLLVKIKAVAINPVDVKTRARIPVGTQEPKILGYDAAGIVDAVGPDVTGFKVGDEVFYAGAIARPGVYAEYHLVDERIVGPKPKSLSFAEAAALPLTSVTAWETLFDRLAIPADNSDISLLIIGGAGGVGSIAIQLARKLTATTIIATASRPDSRAWCEQLGAHHVIDHRESLATQVANLNIPPVAYIFATTATDKHWPAIGQLIAPQGHVGIIDGPENIDMSMMKAKSIAMHWESMFTRSGFMTHDVEAQRQILTRVSQMVDSGDLKTTLAEIVGPISAATITEAHRRIVGDHPSGKMVLEGF